MGNLQDTPNAKINGSESVTLDNDNFSFGAPTFQTAGSLPTAVRADASANKGIENRGNKKKIKSKDKKQSTSSYRNTFVVDESNNKEDMYEINPDEDLDNYTFLAPSPAVPELIVDVLKADVNSDRSDGYSIPSVDINNVKSNLAEISTDDNLNHIQVSEPSPSNGNSSDEKWIPDSGLHFPIMFRRSKKDPGSRQYNELVKELSSVLKKRESARAQSFHENTSQTSLNVDAASTRDEGRKGSKSFDYLNVFSDKSLLNKLETHLINKSMNLNSMKEERHQKTELNNGDVDHELSRNGTIKTKLTPEATLSDSAHDSESVGNNLLNAPHPHIAFNKETFHTEEEPVYSVPHKASRNAGGNKKEVSVKTKDDISSSSFVGEIRNENFSSSSPPRNVDHTKISDFAGQNLVNVKTAAHTAETVTYFNQSNELHTKKYQVTHQQFIDSHKEDTHENNQMLTNSQHGRHQDSQVFANFQHGSHQDNQMFTNFLHGSHRDSQIIRNSMYGIQPNSNNRNSVLNAGTLVNSISELRRSEDNVNYSNYYNGDKHFSAVSSSSMMLSPLLPNRRVSQNMDDSWSDSQGHVTKVEVSGRLLKKRDKFMRSEPDLTQAGSMTSDSDAESRYASVVGKTNSNVIQPAYVSSSHEFKHYDTASRKERRWNYIKAHHSFENLHSDSSLESKDFINTHQTSTSFSHNQSYDISFGNETFDDEHSFHDRHFDHYSSSNFFTNGSSNPYTVKVRVGDGNIGFPESRSSSDFATKNERCLPVRVERASSYLNLSYPESDSVTVFSGSSYAAFRVNMEGDSSSKRNSRSLDRNDSASGYNKQYSQSLERKDSGSSYQQYSHSLDRKDSPSGYSKQYSQSLERKDSASSYKQLSQVLDMSGSSSNYKQYSQTFDNRDLASNYKQYSQSLDRKATVMREVSQRSSSSSSSHASSRCRIARSQTLERNNRNQRQNDHQQQRHLYVKRSPRREFSHSPSSAGSGTGTRLVASTSAEEMTSASQMFVVVPPLTGQVRVPDLIVDHQQTQDKTQKHKDRGQSGW